MYSIDLSLPFSVSSKCSMISDTGQVDKLHDEHEHEEVEGSQTGMIVGIVLAVGIIITLAVLAVLLHLT